LDSADTDDDAAPPDKVAAFSAQLDKLGNALREGDGWIVTHRPIWALKPAESTKKKKRDKEEPVNVTEQVAARDHDLSGVNLVLSGHVHMFSATSFGAERPSQLIVGDGGDIPAFTEADAQARQTEVADMAADMFVVRHYGYAVLDRKVDGWLATLYSAADRPLAICDIAWRKIACHTPAP
jgi:hypothetical protein